LLRPTHPDHCVPARYAFPKTASFVGSFSVPTLRGLWFWFPPRSVEASTPFFFLPNFFCASGPVHNQLPVSPFFDLRWAGMRAPSFGTWLLLRYRSPPTHRFWFLTRATLLFVSFSPPFLPSASLEISPLDESPYFSSLPFCESLFVVPCDPYCTFIKRGLCADLVLPPHTQQQWTLKEFSRLTRVSIFPDSRRSCDPRRLVSHSPVLVWIAPPPFPPYPMFND